MTALSRAQYGTVEVEMHDGEASLEPTLKAYERIDKKFGGIRPALSAISGMDLTAAAEIVAAGMGAGQRELPEVKERVFRTGILNVMPKITEFLMLLMNPTGKEIDEGAEPSGDEEGTDAGN